MLASLPLSNGRVRGTPPRSSPELVPLAARVSKWLFSRAVAASILVGAATGCKDVGGTPPLPAGTSDPGALNNPAGALTMYQTAVVNFVKGPLLSGGGTLESGYIGALVRGGLLGDELQPSNLGGPTLSYEGGQGALDLSGDYAVDARRLPERNEANPQQGGLSFSTSYVNVYTGLQKIRGSTAQALGALRTYRPADVALRGHLYALTGYAELMLADLFCSGVPLSTLDYNGDFTYQPGSTTQQVYQHAVALFDTAITLSADSTRFLDLARVGKGRALLDLGEYALAAQAVAVVPDTFQYQFQVDWSTSSFGNGFGSILVSVSDQEGGVGRPFRSSGDPRTASSEAGTNSFGFPVYFPDKYGSPTATSPVTVASGIEARLIEAEAALQGGDVSGWLGKLNQLRQQFAPTLPQLVDPGTAAARVDTLFAERAAWLFLDGHRQGDLRRLVREYHRDADTVYPSGPYPAVFETYGSDVNFPVPAAERLNPHFTGCFNRGA